MEVGLTVIGYGGGGKDYFFLLIGISLCLRIRYGLDMYIPDRISVGSSRRNGEEDGVLSVFQPLWTYFLPDGLPFLGKCREVAADSHAVVDAPADALTRAYALEVIDQPCAHIWRDFLDCYLEDVVLGVVRNPSVGLSYDARGMVCRVGGLHNGRSCCCCRL